jgi:hypothetical protein
MLAPYPDRLRSSRSTPATPSNPNANSASTPSSTPTPPPPPSHVLSSTSASQHKLFSSRSSTRMRTNSLSSASPSHHADSPSSSTDHVSSRPFRNSSRRPAPNSRPSTSSGVPDQKHQPLSPIFVPPSAAIPVSPLPTYHPSVLVSLYSFCSLSPTLYPLVEKAPKGPLLRVTKAPLLRN